MGQQRRFLQFYSLENNDDDTSSATFSSASRDVLTQGSHSSVDINEDARPAISPMFSTAEPTYNNNNLEQNADNTRLPTPSPDRNHAALYSPSNTSPMAVPQTICTVMGTTPSPQLDHIPLNSGIPGNTETSSLDDSTEPTIEHTGTCPEIDLASELRNLSTENTQTNNEYFDPNPFLDIKDQTPLHVFAPELQNILRAPVSIDTWDRFEETLQRITSLATELLKLPTTSNHNRPARQINVQDPQSIQKLYRRNRRRAMRLILEGESRPCEIDRITVEDYFTQAWSPTDMDPSFYLENSTIGTPVNLQAFSTAEVLGRLRKCENSSPGDDRLTYHHWRTLDPDAVLITLILNTCLKFKKIPKPWKSTSTILIYKKGDRQDLGNWRPISISRTLYKMYTGCLAQRLSQWIREHKVLSSCQKGFLPFDGVFEHNFVLQERLDQARKSRQDLVIAWLDIANAFGSVPHEAITTSLKTLGAGQPFVDVVEDLYADATSKILLSSGETDKIPILAGVRQGCPISGLLFNIAIDPILRAIQNTNQEHNILAYADDICLLATCPEALQQQINEIIRLGSKIGLALKPSKCAVMNFSGQTPVGCREVNITINGQPIRSLKDGESVSFLGRPVGFNTISDWTNLDSIIRTGLTILSSKLAPWQRLDAMKTFFFPSLQYALRTRQFPKGDWKKVDTVLRPELKKTLNLPQEASNDYIYGSRKLGACGIPVLNDDADILSIDGAYKLLTSTDPIIADLALSSLRDTVATRLRRPADQDDVAAYLTGTQDGNFQGSTNAFRNHWTEARKSSSRLGVRWQIEGDVFYISHGQSTIRPKQRRVVCRTIRDNLARGRFDDLVKLSSQGKVMECIALSSSSSHFLSSGYLTRFADWRFIHRARLNILPLNACRPWAVADKRCRRCGNRDETLPHVINHCMRYSTAMKNRHNLIVDQIKKAAIPRFTVVAENQECGVPGLRPDLVISKGDSAFIVDVTMPFENRPEALEAARNLKLEKYVPVRNHLRMRYKNVSIEPIIVGPLGTWDPANDPFLRKVCSRRYASLLRKIAVSNAIRISRDIYTEHITGVTQ